MRGTLAVVVLTLYPLVAWAQLCGDADGDTTVTVNDGVQTLRGAAMLSTVCSSDVCDVDGDGTITVTDGVNVLRAAALLSAQHKCPSEVTGFLDDVEGADGTDSSLDIGVAPVPGSSAPDTVSDVDGAMNIQEDGENAVTVTYDTGGGAVAGQIAAAGDPSLIVGVRTLRGVPHKGFFKLPLKTPSGQITVILDFPPQFPENDFLLGFATLDDGVVSQIMTLRQHVGPNPTPTRTPRPTPTPTPVCGNGIREGNEQCDGTDSVNCAGVPCQANCTCLVIG